MVKETSILLLFHIAIVALLMSGCEKGDYYADPEGQEQKGDKVSDDDGFPDDESESSDDSGGSEHSQSDTLSVSEFIMLGDNGEAYVKGYIIGDCTKNYKNADFTPPFSQPQAILLADRQDERDFSKIMAVQLKSGTKVREHMNLVDHPNWWGRLVVFSGYRTTYLGMPGMKSISAYPTYDP